MHILRNSTPLPINYGMTLPPCEWLCQDEHAFAYANGAPRGTVELEKWRIEATGADPRDISDSECANIKSILLIRSGAIGDLLLLSPCIEPLKKKYPNAIIHLSRFSKHADVVQDFGAGIKTYPLMMDEIKGYDLIIPLENIVELSTEQGIHATDAFAEALGVTVTDYRPVYKVTDNELIDARNLVDHPSAIQKPRIALQLHASSIIRNYPVQLWIQVIQSLVTRGWEIMLLGNQDAIKGAPDCVKDCSKLSFREAAAVLATCDVFCGVDSSFFNLCPALGVPAIGLFGPVGWKTRIKDTDKQRALCTPAPCAPCGWTNSRGGFKFPPNGPCAKLGYCVPLSEITPGRIVAKIERDAKK